MSSKPCVGCGWCCISDPCELSHRTYGYTKRCPDLYWDNGMNRYLCRMMQDAEIGKDAKQQLFEGQGCCAPLMPWRDDVRNRDND